MYSQEQLIALNPSYHNLYTVTPDDVAMINELVTLIEAERQIDPPQPLDGDIVICENNECIITEHGHLQRRTSMTDFMTICVDPYVPFIDPSLYCDASGGYWHSLYPFDLERFRFVDKKQKTFKAWGHNGMIANGAIYFEVEVFVWQFHDPRFY